VADLEERARALARQLTDAVGVAAAVIAEPQRALVGGGSVPGFELDSWVIAVEPRSGGAERVAAGLRRASVPVLARVREERVLLDVRTLLPGDAELVTSALASALSG
jgi:L-seryl-tRNA(Ser) seleniumtransferase